MTASRASKQRKAQQDAFLALLEEGHSVRHACIASGFPRQSAYDLRARDETFAQAWVDADEAGVQVLEEEARRRAVEGVEDFRVVPGGVVEIRRYSDTLLIFLLKAKRPDVYRERFEHRGEIKHTVNLAKLSDKELAALEQLVGKAT